MRPLRIAFAVLSLAALGACADDYNGSGYYASGGYVDPYEERHRAWWAAHNRELAYERREAVREHRVFCSKYPDDGSCVGWYHPNEM
jgi:hypothetical protein